MAPARAPRIFGNQSSSPAHPAIMEKWTRLRPPPEDARLRFILISEKPVNVPGFLYSYRQLLQTQ
jgi:hypothetical protein